jgi:peptide/nickel transport system substrate-binding protein
MHRWIRKALVVVTVVLVGTVLASFVEAAVKEKVVVHGDTSSIPTLDPIAIYLGATANIWQNLYQGLVQFKFNSFEEVEKDLAEGWTVSDDGLVYTFKLRDNVKWHRGFGKVTAQDVKFSFDRNLDPKNNSVWIGDLGMVKEVRAMDALTVRIFLKYPDPDFLIRCARPRPVAIVCQKAVEKYGKDFGRNPVGSGPFVFESMSREQVVLTANPDYCDGKPEIDRIVFKTIPDMDTLILAMVAGEVDVAWSLPRDATTLGRLTAAGCTVKGVDRGGFLQFLFNPRVKPYDDVRVRRAFYHAIDTDKLIKHVIAGYGESWKSLLPKGYFGYTDTNLLSR